MVASTTLGHTVYIYYVCVWYILATHGAMESMYTCILEPFKREVTDERFGLKKKQAYFGNFL